jgi:hemerythrin-like domain-containing protein
MADIYKLIKQDHDAHRRVLAQLDETQGDSAERRELFETLKREAEAHTAAEEQTFYARLMAEPDGQEKSRHSVSEHKEAADILEELEDMEFSSPGWLTRFRSLKDALEHHMDEEEDEVFALAKKLIPADEAQEIGADFEARKVEEMEEA